MRFSWRFSWAFREALLFPQPMGVGFFWWCFKGFYVVLMEFYRFLLGFVMPKTNNCQDLPTTGAFRRLSTFNFQILKKTPLKHLLEGLGTNIIHHFRPAKIVLPLALGPLGPTTRWRFDWTEMGWKEVVSTLKTRKMIDDLLGSRERMLRTSVDHSLSENSWRHQKHPLIWQKKQKLESETQMVAGQNGQNHFGHIPHRCQRKQTSFQPPEKRNLIYIAAARNPSVRPTSNPRGCPSPCKALASYWGPT